VKRRRLIEPEASRRHASSYGGLDHLTSGRGNPPTAERPRPFGRRLGGRSAAVVVPLPALYGSPMPSDNSFDIVSEINLQEMDNAVNQAVKEITTRYDFKGTSASISELNRKDKELTLTADAESQLDAVKKVLVEKMIKRGVDPKCLDYQKLEQATHKTVRQKAKLKSGIDKDTAKAIQKQIKELKLKVNASIQGDALRVTGSKRDDLQAVIAKLKESPPGIPLQFTNYR
jgi:cyclic-di-GMP-binding protein